MSFNEDKLELAVIALFKTKAYAHTGIFHE